MSDKQGQANRYAQAVVAAMLERWQEALGQADSLISANHALVGDGDALISAMPAGTPSEILNMLRLLAQEGDLDLLSEVGGALAELTSGSRAPVKAEVTSAKELSATEQEQLRQSLAARYGEGLLFAFGVDPSLLGGLRVRVGDRLIDNSVASRMSKLRESIASAVR